MKIDWLCTEFRVQQSALEHAINGTPTSERRNLLTEANILIMQGIKKLEEASNTAAPIGRYGSAREIRAEGDLHGSGTY